MDFSKSSQTELKSITMILIDKITKRFIWKPFTMKFGRDISVFHAQNLLVKPIQPFLIQEMHSFISQFLKICQNMRFTSIIKIIFTYYQKKMNFLMVKAPYIFKVNHNLFITFKGRVNKNLTHDFTDIISS